MNKIYANRIAAYLNREPADFTREDLVKYIKENGIKMLNFRYVAGDGRLKTLNLTGFFLPVNVLMVQVFLRESTPVPAIFMSFPDTVLLL